MATTGQSVLRLAASHVRAPDECHAVESLLSFAGRAPLSEGWWSDGWYHRDYSRHARLLDEVVRVQHSLHGRLNVASLFATPLLGQGFLLGPTGRELTAADLPGLAGPSSSIGELVEVQWVRRRKARFRLKQCAYPYAAASSFRILCDLLVFNYPDLLASRYDPSALVERSASKDKWALLPEAGAIHLIRQPATQRVQHLGAVESLSHAQAVARRATGRRRVHFAPHTLLCAAMPLWGSMELFSKRRLRSIVAGSRQRQAQEECTARERRADALSPAFAGALARIDWGQVFDLPDSSSRQRLLFLKTKGLRLSGWDVTNSRRGCPHCAAAGHAGGSTFHIVWDCPSARQLWGKLRSWWAALGLWTGTSSTDERDFFTAVFSLRLPPTPPRVWDTAPLSQHPRTEDAPEGPYPAFQAAWQQLVLETLVVILGWRHSRYDPTRAWSEASAAAVHDASCQRVLALLAHRRTLDAQARPLHVRLLTDLRERIRDTPRGRRPAPPGDG